MKKLTVTFCSLVLAVSALAQDAAEPPKKETKKKDPVARPVKGPPFYLTTGTGVNNNYGLIGLVFDVPVQKYFSIEGGGGISTWGTKIGLSGKYYMKEYERGWAFGFGLTYSSGRKTVTTNMETIYGNENVTIDFNPQTNLFLAAYHYWNLGKRRNRFYLEGGWSAALSGGDKFKQVAGDPLSDNSTRALNFIAPGGLIVGVGFSFAIYK